AIVRVVRVCGRSARSGDGCPVAVAVVRIADLGTVWILDEDRPIALIVAVCSCPATVGDGSDQFVGGVGERQRGTVGQGQSGHTIQRVVRGRTGRAVVIGLACPIACRVV